MLKGKGRLYLGLFLAGEAALQDPPDLLEHLEQEEPALYTSRCENPLADAILFQKAEQMKRYGIRSGDPDIHHPPAGQSFLPGISVHLRHLSPGRTDALLSLTRCGAGDPVFQYGVFISLQAYIRRTIRLRAWQMIREEYARQLEGGLSRKDVHRLRHDLINALEREQGQKPDPDSI